MNKDEQPLVSIGFEPDGVGIPIKDILPLKLVTDSIKHSAKYVQIASSIEEVGMVEPPVVARHKRGKFLLVDGHLRLEVLKDLGNTTVTCLVSTDDESFTYNKRINRLTIVQEHRMILEAVKRGVPEERLAKALNVNIKSLRAKRQLLNGICPEVVAILNDKNVPLNTFLQLKKLKQLRQIEAAELMVAMNKFSVPYAKSLVAATPQVQLIEKKKRKKGLSADQTAAMEKESANLEREFRLAERSFAADHLDLVLARGYIVKLINNEQIRRYLNGHYPAILEEFDKMIEAA